jgi:hypothetical protein
LCSSRCCAVQRQLLDLGNLALAGSDDGLMSRRSLGADDPRACAEAAKDAGQPGQWFRQVPVTPLQRRHLKTNDPQHPPYGINAVCMKTAFRKRPQLAVPPSAEGSTDQDRQMLEILAFDNQRATLVHESADPLEHFSRLRQQM